MLADSISPGAVKTEDEHCREICTAGRWIHGRGFVASTDGNISVRLDSRRILTSPTGVSKGLMSPDDLVITDLRGRKLAGRREPSPELSDALEPLVQNYDAILLANHGVVTCGADLLTAFFRMETVEHFAQVSLATELLGKQVLLSGRDVEKLLAARARYGTTTAAPVTSNCPVTSDNAAGGSNRISVTREELEALIEEA